MAFGSNQLKFLPRALGAAEKGRGQGKLKRRGWRGKSVENEWDRGLK